MKSLFNLILLIALCAGGFYAYIHITEDYELIAQLKNMQDQALVEFQAFMDELEQEWEDLKQDANNKKRSVGL